MFVPLSKVIKDLKRRNRYQKKTQKCEIEKKWQKVLSQILDKNIINKTEIIRFDKGKLLVRVENSEVLHELQARKQKIIALLNKDEQKEKTYHSPTPPPLEVKEAKIEDIYFGL